MTAELFIDFDAKAAASRDAPEWKALKGLIEESVTLQETQVRLAGYEMSWFRVANPEELLEVALASGEAPEEVDPFWAGTWRSAMGLDQFLSRLDCQGLRVLELGCGTGQAGTAAALRGAEVVMTDSVSLALQVAQLNAWPLGDKIQFHRLRWGTDSLDLPKFPVVIGSDLIYDTSLFPQLESSVRQHLATDGKLYLAEPSRHSGERFSSWIVEAGWQRTEHVIHLQDQIGPIRILECWR